MMLLFFSSSEEAQAAYGHNGPIGLGMSSVEPNQKQETPNSIPDSASSGQDDQSPAMSQPSQDEKGKDSAKEISAPTAEKN
jgi:hypothetical protein